MDNIFKSLNQSQLEAVKHIDGALLVVAGAGSGKTKTITTRLAYLLSLGVDPASTLTLTFTNKAASEMRERAMGMLQSVAYPPLLCTFHKFGLLFLKYHIKVIDRKENFVVIDSDDRKKIIKSFSGELPPALLSSEISNFKNALISPAEALGSASAKTERLIGSAYEKYEKYLISNNVVDFDDLLVLPYKILAKDGELCEKVSKKYSFIMVDEYQDTNTLQYMLIKKLCSTHNNICAVGDDDQSIYGWRGANINNILDFTKNFEGAKIIKLENNYRSTSSILDVANKLISFNKNRLGKTLISFLGDGKEVVLYSSADEEEESAKIASKIKTILDTGVNPKNIAVLYRVNSLSRALEDKLNRHKIPYKMIGTVRFYERAEIKDAISYFRLIINPDDNFSFSRVINRPKRGVGKTTIEKLEYLSSLKGCSIYALSRDYKEEFSSSIGAKQARAIEDFFEILAELKGIAEESVMRFIEVFDENIGLKEQYKYDADGLDRVANLDELYALFRDFFIKNLGSSMEDFLNDLSLQSDADSISGEKISCMSIHASKGLEFEYLFVIGLEEGIFPLLREGIDIEEERRLAYVALTRAKEHLFLSYVASRFHNGKRNSLLPSRFLREGGVLKKREDSFTTYPSSSEFAKGDAVNHKIFGFGMVLDVKKAGGDYLLTINFGGSQKTILSSYVQKI